MPRAPIGDQLPALVGAGLSNRAVAERSGITEGTVEFHVSDILKRIGARNRTEAVRIIGDLRPSKA